jgi:nitroreductase
METWDAIRARRNVRQYRPDPVSEADLDRIVDAARRAPSAGNNQPWDFVVVTDKAQLKQLSTVWMGAAHIADAPAAIALIIAKAVDDEHAKLLDPSDVKAVIQFDLGQAMAAMTIAAADLGIGTGHTWVDDKDKARAILGVPDDHIVCYLLAVGYPADRPLRPIRKPDRCPLAEVMHREHW